MSYCRELIRERLNYLADRYEIYKNEDAIFSVTLLFKWEPDIPYRPKVDTYNPFEIVYSRQRQHVPKH